MIEHPSELYDEVLEYYSWTTELDWYLELYKLKTSQNSSKTTSTKTTSTII